MFGNNPSKGTQNSSGALIRPEPDASFKTSSAQSETSTTTTQNTVTFDEERKTVTIATIKQNVIHQQRAHVLEINSRKSATAEDVENFIRNMNVDGAGAGTSNFRGSSGNAATTQPTFRSTPIPRTVVPRLKYSYGPSFTSSISGIAGSAGSLGYSRVRTPTTPTVGRTEETTVVQNRGNTLTERTEIKPLSRTSYGSSAASNALALTTKSDANPFGNSVAKLGTSSSASVTRSPTNSSTGTILRWPSTYNSDKPHPGQCFIFNHVEFDTDCVSTREGSDVDALRLRQTFEYLMLEVFEHRNPTLKQITEQIREITYADYSAHACLVIVILSHGDRNEKISAKDGIFSLNDKIVFPILENPTLKGKPKLFFIQTCKGAMQIKTDSVGDPNKQFGGSCDNILKCYSTFEGYVSFRKNTGSYFIQTLCEKLKIHGTSKTIEDIMDYVREAVKIQSGGGQIPSITHTMLTKFSFGDAIRKLRDP